jgi:hypothetical protein
LQSTYSPICTSHCHVKIDGIFFYHESSVAVFCLTVFLMSVMKIVSSVGFVSEFRYFCRLLSSGSVRFICPFSSFYISLINSCFGTCLYYTNPPLPARKRRAVSEP